MYKKNYKSRCNGFARKLNTKKWMTNRYNKRIKKC